MIPIEFGHGEIALSKTILQMSCMVKKKKKDIDMYMYMWGHSSEAYAHCWVPASYTQQ